MKDQISRKKIKSHLRMKTKSDLKETIALALKHPNWLGVAKILAGPTRKQISINLFEIDAKTKVGDTVLIFGKVLSKGELTKKIRICALSISESALEKLKSSKSEFVTIEEEIKKNLKFEGIRILTQAGVPEIKDASKSKLVLIPKKTRSKIEGKR